METFIRIDLVTIEVKVFFGVGWVGTMVGGDYRPWIIKP